MRLKRMIFVLLILSSTFFSACAQQPYNHPMGGSGYMMGYGGGYGGIFMWLILIIIAGVIIYFFLIKNKNIGFPGASTRESPIDILKTRYAKGEITKEEFERLKKDLEN